ncbi:unannotated protein [freshwater metagenome]|uniref:Unannotated protein n=1 Tax=freshwater metagenome TaxID=449393 RepID=A0A6J7UVJ0_9ZZZZ|nr:septum formation initiator family protein [Actinomycetota bacterium]MTA47559.1 septum formation initiator family protein [Actinomycetota bacterium]
MVTHRSPYARGPRQSRYSRTRNNSRSRGSGRALTLGIILFILAFTLAPPTQRYFAQRAQISAVKAQLHAGDIALADAKRELERWRDPSYIKSQARERLHFVMPGERQYIVTDSTQATQEAPATAVSKDLPSGLPWYNRVISSITEVQNS